MSAVAYLVVANPSSKNNLGTLIRCAAAFGVEEVVVVGASKWSTHGAHGSHKHVKYRWFGDWDSAATFLRLERGCDLCGIVQASISNKPSASSSSKTIVAAVAGNTLPPSAPPPAATTASATRSTATTASTTPSTATTASTTACAPPDASDGRVSFNQKSQEEEAGMGTGHVLDGRQNEERSEERSGDVGEIRGMGTGHVLDGGQNEERSEERSGDVGETRRDGVGTAGTAVITACEYSYDSLAVHHRPFRRSTAFLVGHLNRLEAKALDVCDFLVHVEQATGFVMDLGPPVTTSIALHHFTAWANYEERRFEGEKFDVDKNAARCRPPVITEKGLTKERLRMREELRAADPLEAGGGGSGGDGDDNAEIGGGLKWLKGVGDEDVDEDADY